MPSSQASFACFSVYWTTLGASNSISVGSTASAPQTRKKGVKPTEQFGVVRRLQSTEGSSLTQQPAECSRGSTSLGLMPARTNPFAFSTCPLD
jgi:hypothetical protein